MKKRYPLSVSIMAGLMTALVSCEKEELPVKPRERGDVKETGLSLGADYRHQVWYDLGSDNVVSTNFKTDWHIAFSCPDSADLIYLNTSLAAQAAISGEMSFEELSMDEGLIYRPDRHSGSPDSLAIGNRASQGKACVIDLGYDENGTALGKIKFQITGISKGIYSFRYADLDGTNSHTAAVEKEEMFNRIAYSFTSHKTLKIEPPKEQYDLCFTQYTYVFYDPYTPYLVTGVLINSHEVEVALDTAHEFSAIDRNMLPVLTFGKDADIIGYDWKYFDFGAGTYIVDPSVNYVIRDHEGYYYKLHFTDFYDEQGRKGSPKFEFQRL